MYTDMGRGTHASAEVVLPSSDPILSSLRADARRVRLPICGGKTTSATNFEATALDLFAFGVSSKGVILILTSFCF